jgi:hypothetical protein
MAVALDIDPVQSLATPSASTFRPSQPDGLGRQLMVQQSPRATSQPSSRKNALCCPRRLFILPFRVLGPPRCVRGKA